MTLSLKESAEAFTNRRAFWDGITQAKLRSLLSYDPETGVFTWLTGTHIGSRAGTLRSDGYRSIKIDGKRCVEHRLAWLYIFGEFPRMLDHKNGIRTDNRLANLRPATGTQNQGNRRIDCRNTSGAKGVSYYKPTGRWHARLRVNGRVFSLGHFKTVEEAAKAYQEAAEKYFGEFARTA